MTLSIRASVRIRSLDLVSDWLAVMHTYIYTILGVVIVSYPSGNEERLLDSSQATKHKMVAWPHGARSR